MDFINELELILKQRKQDLPEGSYTTTLFEGGLDRILRKVGEESGEVIIAAKNQDNAELKNEAADLFFHLLVLLQNQNMSFNDVVDVLKSRHQK
jgi:phosphoribosyl-ATP pyrophosphohydrolase